MNRTFVTKHSFSNDKIQNINLETLIETKRGLVSETLEKITGQTILGSFYNGTCVTSKESKSLTAEEVINKIYKMQVDLIKESLITNGWKTIESSFGTMFNNPETNERIVMIPDTNHSERFNFYEITTPRENSHD